MRRSVALGLAIVLSACGDDTLSPHLPPLELRIVSPAPDDSLAHGDTVLFLGEATGDDIGLLPDDSTWWSEGGWLIGRGRRVAHIVREGARSYRFHARYGSREDSVSLALSVGQAGIGQILWVVAMSSPEWGVSDGLALGPSGVLYARDYRTIVAIALDGSVLWRSELPVFIYGHAPAIAPDGTIYYGFVPAALVKPGGGVIALSGDGAIKWIFRNADHLPPEVYGLGCVHWGVALDSEGTIYFRAEYTDSPMYAVWPDGTLKWRVSTISGREPSVSMKGIGTPVLVGDTLAVVAQRRDSVVAVDTRDGTLRWSRSLPGSSGYRDPSPAVDFAGNIYIARADSLSAFSSTGDVLWSRALSRPAYSSGPTLPYSYLYLATDSGGVTVMTHDGQPVAEFGSPGHYYHSAATLGENGVLYVAGHDTLYSYASDGAVRYRVPVHHTAYAQFSQGGPVIGPDGTVYFRAWGHGVVAIRDTVGPASTAPWPMLGGGPTRRGRRD